MPSGYDRSRASGYSTFRDWELPAGSRVKLSPRSCILAPLLTKSPAWPATHRAVFTLTALAIGALYLWGVQASNGPFDWQHDQAGYYNLLSRAFAQGRLHLSIEPSPELLALPYPWDPARNAPYSVLDLVLFNRRYYLYHGAAPAWILFTPWLLVTHRDLPESFAVFVFCFLGYLCSCGVLMRFLSWMRLRPPLPVFAALLLALGICSSVPFLLQRVWVYEVAIAGGYFCLSAGFWFLARGLLAARPAASSLAISGTMLGLAIGCRPHLAFAALFAGLLLLWCLGFRSRRLLAFVLPVAAVVLLLASYNYARFRDPFEFGLRYQMAGRTYFRPSLSLENLTPGLYYLLASPPKFERVFPFVRLALRMPFNSLDYRLPARYFVEPIAGALAVWPLTLLALAAPLCLRRLPDRPARALLGAMGLSALASLGFVAGLGLVSHRFQLDFLPSLVLVACCLLGWASARAASRALAVAAALALVYSLLLNLAIGIQGPYDGFVQAHPAAYVKLARWFSPLTYFRPLLNPRLTIEASYEFPASASGPLPLLAAGRCGSRYLLTAEMLGANRVRLVSAGAPTSGDVAAVEVDALPGTPHRLRLDYDPAGRAVTVQWNGQPVLRHVLPFLVTAPSQVTAGVDLTDTGLFQPRFPGRVSAITRLINGVEPGSPF